MKRNNTTLILGVLILTAVVLQLTAVELAAQTPPTFIWTTNVTNPTRMHTGRRAVRSSDSNLHVVLFDTTSAGFSQVFHIDRFSNWTPNIIWTFSYVSTFPSIAIDPNDDLHVVWSMKPMGDNSTDIFYSSSSNGGSTWGPPINVSNTPGIWSHSPVIDIDGLNRIHVAWQEEYGVRIYYSWSPIPASPGSFRPWIDITGPSPILTGEAPSIANTIDHSSGTIHIAWAACDDIGWFIAYRYSPDTGATWNPPLNQVPSNASGGYPGASWRPYPCISVGSDNNPHIVYHSAPPTGVYHVTSGNQGISFFPPSIAETTTTTEYWPAPSLANYTSKCLHLVWHDNQMIYHAASNDDGTTWTSQGPLGWGAWDLYPNLAYKKVLSDSCDYVWTHNLREVSYQRKQFPLAGLEITPSWSSSTVEFSSKAAWGDLDGDGFYELAVTILNNQGIRLYDNINGTLQPSAFWSVSGFSAGQPAWGDHDCDGDIDLFIPCSPLTQNRLYCNQSGTLTTPPCWMSTDTYTTADAEFGNPDNDGDLDVAVAEWQQPTRVPSRVYENIGCVLESTATYWVSHDSAVTGAVAWGDMDNDGDLDLALGNGYGVVNRVYCNMAGWLDTLPCWSSAEAGYTSDIAWGDVDNDGDIDLAVANGSPAPSVRVYYNINGMLEGSSSWQTTDTVPRASHLAWGDVNNDGWLDLAVSYGNWNWSGINRVYLNDGTGTLDTLPSWTASIADNTQGIALGDVDGDGDLDLAVANYFQLDCVYLNYQCLANTPPAPPTDFSSGVGDSVALTWNDGSDAETPVGGLTYNLRVGTTPGGFDIYFAQNVVSPYVSRKNETPSFGNCWHTFTKTFANLPSGTYYWSVQTVDNGFIRSEWAPEETFNVEQFIRSDANADSTITMSDATYTLKHLYVPGSDPPTCMKTADSDDDGEIAMSDAIYTLKHLYVPGSPPPPAPFPDCGVDPTADELGCEDHPCMGSKNIGVKP